MFCANDIHILSSKKKIDFIKPLEEALGKKPDLPQLKLYTRNKVSLYIYVDKYHHLCVNQVSLHVYIIYIYMYVDKYHHLCESSEPMLVSAM